MLHFFVNLGEKKQKNNPYTNYTFLKLLNNLNLVPSTIFFFSELKQNGFVELNPFCLQKSCFLLAADGKEHFTDWKKFVIKDEKGGQIKQLSW